MNRALKLTTTTLALAYPKRPRHNGIERKQPLQTALPRGKDVPGGAR